MVELMATFLPTENQTSFFRRSGTLVFGVLLPVVISLSACSLAPTYQRPEAPIPAKFDTSTVPTSKVSEGRSEPLSTQERLFLKAFSTSDDLVPLVERALANNRDFKVATLQVEQARALNRIDRAQQLPSVNASVQRFRQKFNDPSLDARYGQKLSAATIGTSDFELDFFGRVRSLSDASRHRYLASAQGQRAFRGALISEVLRAYVIDRAAAAQAQQLQNAYLDTLTLLNLAKRQQDVGTLSEDEVNLQRSDTEHSHTTMQQAQTDAAAARNALQLLTGYAGASPAGKVEELANPNESLDWLNSLPSEVLLERPDILQAEEQLRASNADIGAARAAFFPSVTLSTSLGTASDGLGNLFDSGGRVWTFIPQITLPIFNHGRNSANLDLAQLRKQAAVADYERTVQSAFREVSDVLTARNALIERVRSERGLGIIEDERVRRATARFEAGWEDQPRLLSARLRLHQTRIDGIFAQRDLALNRIALFHAFYGVTMNAPATLGKKS